MKVIAKNHLICLAGLSLALLVSVPGLLSANESMIMVPERRRSRAWADGTSSRPVSLLNSFSWVRMERRISGACRWLATSISAAMV